MTSSDLRNHFLGIVLSTTIIFTSTTKSANKDPTVRLLRSGNYAPLQKMDAYLDLRAVTSDSPANDFQIPQHQAIDRRMMLWFVRAIVARAVRNRKGYAVSHDALVILRTKLIILELLKNAKICPEDFKRKSSEEQNCPKSTSTQLLNLCQSQFGSIRRIYHELREKEEVLQNVEDPHMRAELESEFEEESASTKRHTIGVMRLIGKLF
ncbi:hypothetical protein T12_595, partial [Trichinella patagoniensis]